MAAINIITINMTSLIKRERRAELDQLAKDKNTDIILIQETHLKDRHSLRMSNMKVMRNDEGSGTAICIKEGIMSERVTVNRLRVLQVTAARIIVEKKNTIVISIYVPCYTKGGISEDLRIISELCDGFDQCIIGEDWNARNTIWNEVNDGVTNKNGADIERWLDENKEIILRSTRENTFRNDTKLDHFVVSRHMDKDVEVERVITGKCHDAIMMKWSAIRREIEKSEKKIVKSYKNMNWAVFRENMTTNLIRGVKINMHKNMSNEEIDEKIKTITKIIMETEEECTRQCIVGNGRLELTEEVKLHIKKRANAIKEIRRKNISVEWLQRQQEEELTNRIKTISTKGEPFKEIRRLSGQKRKSCAQSKLMVDGRNVVGDKGKAEELAKWYANIAKEKEPQNERKEEIERVYEEVRNAKSGICFDTNNTALSPKEEVMTGTAEIEEIRKKINTKKSSGNDGISNHILRKMPKYFWDCTTVTVKNCMANGYFPNSWKEAIIIPIPKTTKAESPNDYRPISLLSN